MKRSLLSRIKQNVKYLAHLTHIFICLVFKKFLIQFILLLLVNFILIKYLNHKTDIDPSILPIVYCITVIPSFLYFVNVYYHFKKKQFNEPKISKIYSYRPRNQHFTSLVSLLIFYSSLTIFLVLFVPKPPIILIPDMKPGTFGLRAWACNVTLRKLEINYDSNGIWKKIPEEIIYDEKNWSEPTWYDDIRRTLDITFYQTREISESNKEIKLFQCGIIFKPWAKFDFKNANVYAEVTFTKYAEKENDKEFYPGFQFCFNVDPNPQIINEKSYYSELYLAFDYGLFNESKPWIPLLSLLPSVSRPKTFKELNNNGYKLDHDSYPYTVKINAFRLDDQVGLIFHTENSGELTLFEAKINENTLNK